MRTKVINISIPAPLAREADRVAKREYRKRSELYREALRRYLSDKGEWSAIYRYGRRQAAKLGIKSEKDVARIVSEYRHGKHSAESRS